MQNSHMDIFQNILEMRETKTRPKTKKRKGSTFTLAKSPTYA